MTDFDSEDTHRQTRTLYFLGALDPAPEADFERHLAGCAECLDDSEQFGPLLGGMAMLSGEEIGALMREHDADVAGDVAGLGTAAGDRGAPADAADAAGAPAEAPAAADAAGGPADDRLNARRRPQTPGGPPAAEVRRGSRPPARPGGRRRRRVLIGALAAVVLLAVAVGFGVSQLQSGGTTINTQPAGLIAQGSQAAARLMVAVADNGDRVTIRATVVGLRPGTRYRLYAATSDGRTHVVAEWAGDAGAHEVVGELRVTVPELVFFTVAQLDDTVVVTARIGRTQSGSPTH
jgi:Putative zinc-finger